VLVDLDGDHTLEVRHLHRGISSVDDHHESQEEMPLDDVVVPDVEAGYLERQHITLIIPYFIRHLQVDTSNGSGPLH
jgi:hypothetical protein